MVHNTILISVVGRLVNSTVGKRAVEGGIIGKTVEWVRGSCTIINKRKKRCTHVWKIEEHQHSWRTPGTDPPKDVHDMMAGCNPNKESRPFCQTPLKV